MKLSYAQKTYTEKTITLSQTVVDKLKEVGWHRERQVSIAEWRASLADYGLVGHAIAFDLLSNFGRLVVQTINFNPLVDTSLHFSELKEINDESGKHLYPIGIEQISDMMLAVNDDGIIYGLTSNMVFMYGSALSYSLENLFSDDSRPTYLSWNYDEW